MDGGMEGWKDGGLDGWMEGWMDSLLACLLGLAWLGLAWLGFALLCFALLACLLACFLCILQTVIGPSNNRMSLCCCPRENLQAKHIAGVIVAGAFYRDVA